MNRQDFITQVEGIQEGFRRFLCALCCGDSAMADDIAQDALLRAYVSLPSLRDSSKFKSWIFSIGYHEFISHSRTRQKPLSLDAASHLVSEVKADDSLRYEALHMALDSLSEKERVAILLFYMEGYGSEEIANIMESTDGAVRQLLSRGRKHLRTLLTQN